jgi:hypothetical protein
MVELAFLSEQLNLADQLLARGLSMFEPQDLPGRYGRVVEAVDRLLQVIGAEAVVGGGWAVWRHGYVGRITQDLDVVLAANRLEEFLRVASVSGFQVLPRKEGRWPKLLHKDTGVQVDILPEGGRPGTAAQPAPTTIPHPTALGGSGTCLRYITLPSLVELKLAAGRARDESDVVELIRANPAQVEEVRGHLGRTHATYQAAFERLVEKAAQQGDE